MLVWGTGSGVGLGALVLLLRGPIAPLVSPEAEVQSALIAVLVVVAVTQPPAC